MDLIEGIAIGLSSNNEMHPSQELLSVRPSDPRAWELKTVEEYRLFRFSTSYSIGGHVAADAGGYVFELSTRLGVLPISERGRLSCWSSPSMALLRLWARFQLGAN